MINLGFLLHIYQPPNQFPEVLDRIVNECYRPLLNSIVERKAGFTLNMNWSLTEKLMTDEYRDVLVTIQKGLEQNSLEVVGSAAYHAILPLIPPKEQRRQIELNLEKHKNLWHKLYHPRGFFPPEMAYGPEILSVIQEEGFEWLITEDIPFAALHGTVPFDFIPVVNGTGVFLRSSFWSNKISMEKDASGKKYRGDQIAHWMKEDLERWFNGKDGYLVLAMDGETFGHHIPGYIEEFILPFIAAISKMPDQIRLLPLSAVWELFPKIEKEVPPGSWSTSSEDFWAGNFFPLWKNPKNQAHHLLWQLTELALQSFGKLRDKMDRSLNSCTFWWAAINPDQTSPITLSGVNMLMDIIKIADPGSFDKAAGIKKELEKALNR